MNLNLNQNPHPASEAEHFAGRRTARAPRSSGEGRTDGRRNSMSIPMAGAGNLPCYRPPASFGQTALAYSTATLGAIATPAASEKSLQACKAASHGENVRSGYIEIWLNTRPIPV